MHDTADQPLPLPSFSLNSAYAHALLSTRERSMLPSFPRPERNLVLFDPVAQVDVRLPRKA